MDDTYRYSHLCSVLLYNHLKQQLNKHYCDVKYDHLTNYIVSNDIFAFYFFDEESLPLVKTLNFVKRYKKLMLFIDMDFNIDKHYKYLSKLFHPKLEYLYVQMESK